MRRTEPKQAVKEKTVLLIGDSIRMGYCGTVRGPHVFRREPGDTPYLR